MAKRAAIKGERCISFSRSAYRPIGAAQSKDAKRLVLCDGGYYLGLDPFLLSLPEKDGKGGAQLSISLADDRYGSWASRFARRT